MINVRRSNPQDMNSYSSDVSYTQKKADNGIVQWFRDINHRSTKTIIGYFANPNKYIINQANEDEICNAISDILYKLPDSAKKCSPYDKQILHINEKKAMRSSRKAMI